MGVTLKNDLRVGPGEKRQCMFEEIHYFCRADHLITLHPFTVTNVNVTPAIAFIDGRPGATLAGAGASTDGSNFCYGDAGIRLVAGKMTRLFFGIYMADATQHEWAFGLNVVTTTMVANLSGGTLSTDFFVLNKDNAELIPEVRARKASGTAVTQATSLTCANDTWYDFEMVIVPDASTAGKGRVQVYCQTDLGAKQRILTHTFATGVPDTVDMALAFGFLEGDSGTDATTVSHIGIQQEA